MGDRLDQLGRAGPGNISRSGEIKAYRAQGVVSVFEQAETEGVLYQGRSAANVKFLHPA